MLGAFCSLTSLSLEGRNRIQAAVASGLSAGAGSTMVAEDLESFYHTVEHRSLMPEKRTLGSGEGKVLHLPQVQLIFILVLKT